MLLQAQRICDCRHTDSCLEFWEPLRVIHVCGVGTVETVVGRKCHTWRRGRGEAGSGRERSGEGWRRGRASACLNKRLAVTPSKLSPFPLRHSFDLWPCVQAVQHAQGRWCDLCVFGLLFFGAGRPAARRKLMRMQCISSRAASTIFMARQSRVCNGRRLSWRPRLRT